MSASTLQTPPAGPQVQSVEVRRLHPSPFSISLYGDPALSLADLLESIQREGILEPLVVAPAGAGYEVLSGTRRLACATQLGLRRVPCVVRELPPGAPRRLAVLEHNRQRNKTFSQRMREADALEGLLAAAAQERRLGNLRRPATMLHVAGGSPGPLDRRNSDGRSGRTDAAVARAVGLGGKDLFRQARAIWRAAQAGDVRAQAGVTQLDACTKTIHAAYKDLRRRDRFTTGFRPTPYDIWAFRHDRAFGIPHPGSIPPAIIAHAVHYFSPPGGLVVDPMAGGGTTLDVCEGMGRRCLAYDLHPLRPEIRAHDIGQGLPAETAGCDLLFCDPPYHTMRAGQYPGPGLGEMPLDGWVAFLHDFSRIAYTQLRVGGHVALLLACQTEKDLPSGVGYIDHAFLGFNALSAAGFRPVRRISCPMSGGYRPQQVRQARSDGRLLGLVRDLLVMQKPGPGAGATPWVPGIAGVQGSPPASS